MTSRRLIVLVAASVLSLFAVREALAGPPSDQLRGHIDRVLKVLDDSELKKDGKVRERRTAIREIANDIFDFGEISKRTLGRHWQARTPSEKEEFVQLLADLLERTYISKIELYTGEKVSIVAESIDSELATVRTKIASTQGAGIPVDYRMFRQGDRWRAYDVAVEGVSLVGNYRSQFNAIIQKSSYRELVRLIKAKQDERPEAEDSKRKERRVERRGPVGAGEEAPAAAGKPRQAP
ncbi:MAG: ABC transporter substrate-binding protein [Candidatus Rokubacteria bacterium]|nr:ABC transporter substrate-binding protein [Candidatus Rokubacteria bacterium]